jgi:hypothetical protein
MHCNHCHVSTSLVFIIKKQRLSWDLSSPQLAVCVAGVPYGASAATLKCGRPTWGTCPACITSVMEWGIHCEQLQLTVCPCARGLSHATAWLQLTTDRRSACLHVSCTMVTVLDSNHSRLLLCQGNVQTPTSRILRWSVTGKQTSDVRQFTGPLQQHHAAALPQGLLG